MDVVPNIFNGHVLAVYDESEKCGCLAQGKQGPEQFSSIIVSGPARPVPGRA
jgi:hypothetical protein